MKTTFSQSKPRAIFVLMVVMGILLFLRFTDFFTHPNSRVLEPWGDGYKAYHAILYHAQHDSTLSHFQGMNYPYGDHIVPGACQPLVSNSLRILDSVGINLIPYGFGIIHIFLLVGLLLCALFLFLIFHRLGLPNWYSLLIAIGLTFLTPQMERMISHYGLAHPELLPMVFYLLLRWHERPHWKWSAWIGVVVWTYSLIHFYYFAILTFAIVGWVGIRWLLQKDWKQTLSYLGHGILMLGIPLLFFFFWMIYNDPITDRNAVPWGFFVFRSWSSAIFTHLDIPYWQWVNDHFITIPKPNIESQSYIGLVAAAFLLVFSGKWIRTLFRRWPLTVSNKGESFLQYWLLSGIVILIFAHGVPFIFDGWDRFLKYTGPIQQFRSIGRFAWVFYYAVNISAFYYIYTLWEKNQNSTGAAPIIDLPSQPLAPKGENHPSTTIGDTPTNNSLWKKAWIVLPILLLFFESWQYTTGKDLALDALEDHQEGQRFTDLDIDYDRFQAILPIPYFNIGSDNFWLHPEGWVSQRPHTLSLQTGLPLCSAMLTRTSLSQTINQLQLVCEPYRMPLILDDYPNDKPLLLFLDSERIDQYGDLYTHFNEHSKLLYEKGWMHLYEVPLESFQQRLDDRTQQVQKALDSLYILPNDWLASDSTAQWYYDGYDANQHDNAYMGKGDFLGNMGHWNRLADTVWQSNYTGDITISFWQFINSDRSSWTIANWTEYDANNGEELFKQTRITKDNIKIFDDQGWALVEFTLPKQKANSRIELILTHDVLRDGELRVDELLIRPANIDIGRKQTGGLWWNNRFYLK